ncbi:magnesium transporter [Candidatus Woesebacteria bacterium]|nr:MAG: magnesium transporter [Candidatus Woesebacteria bacterium]
MRAYSHHHKNINHTGQIDDVFKLSLTKSLKHRLPWLFIGLLGGLLASKIVGGFEELLSTNIVLAGFIPLIVYMSDAVGTQMESYVIRDFAMHPKINFIKYFMKHLTTVTFVGLIVSLLLFLSTLILNHELTISMVLSISLFFSILSSVFTGLIMPRIFEKTNTDPANASGPIATIIQDILSITIYFFVASLIL